MQPIKVVQGDYGYQMPFVLTDGLGNIFNLSGFTLLLIVQFANTSGTKFSGSMVVDNATAGTCHYIPASTDFDKFGVYRAQIQATNGGGEVITFPDIVINARQKLPLS